MSWKTIRQRFKGYFHEDNDWSPILAKRVDWSPICAIFSDIIDKGKQNKGVDEEAASEEKKRTRLFFLTN